MSKIDITLTAERLKEMLSYDPETGLFTWLIHSGPAYPGKLANGIDITTGYIRIRIGRNYQAHRLAWLYVHGVWPIDDIDHINGVRSDNRIANLRNITRGANTRNAHMLRNASVLNPTGTRTSKYLGVCWSKTMNKFQASMKRHGKVYRLGYFDVEEDAAAAYQKARDEFDLHEPSTTNP